MFMSSRSVRVKPLAIGERGDADALLVHDRTGEDKLVAEGYGIDRRDVMYNDFVIVGPNTDPAHIRGLTDARKALTQIADAKALFASRGDDSGTLSRSRSRSIDSPVLLLLRPCDLVRGHRTERSHAFETVKARNIQQRVDSRLLCRSRDPVSNRDLVMTGSVCDIWDREAVRLIN
jgi:hypothetical protein